MTRVSSQISGFIARKPEKDNWLSSLVSNGSTWCLITTQLQDLARVLAGLALRQSQHSGTVTASPASLWCSAKFSGVQEQSASLIFNPAAFSAQQKAPSPSSSGPSAASHPPSLPAPALSWPLLPLLFCCSHRPAPDGSLLRILIPSLILHCSSEQCPLRTAMWGFREEEGVQVQEQPVLRKC